MRTVALAGVAAALACGLVASGPVQADPWKDESGNRYRDGAYGGIPPGHLPPPGRCRVWYDDRPPGHQPPPMSCRRAERLAARTGGWVVGGGRDGHDWDRAPYAGDYGRDASFGYYRVCEAFGRYGECLEWGLRARR